MIDVFEEINLLHNEIEEEMDILNNLMKYSSEVLETSYVNEVDYQNQDLCLDYISFTEYSIMISKNLKQILRKSQQEIEDYKQKIKMLKLLLNHLLNEVARLSVFSVQDFQNLLKSFGVEFNFKPDLKQVFIFLASEAQIIINPIFSQFLTPEIISFLKDYISDKYNEGTLLLSTYLKDYIKLREIELQR